MELIEWREFQICFGDAKHDLNFFEEHYPQYRFARQKQVHGCDVHLVTEAQIPPDQTGDALISRERNVALGVWTADCTPVLVAEPNGWFGAAHAGWRGVAGKIVPRMLAELQARGVAMTDLRVWIGPHILQDSFEVQKDVRDQLLDSLPPGRAYGLYEFENARGRFQVSLVQILMDQIRYAGVPLLNIDLELEDTLTNDRYCSARREPQNPRRQLSWIARN